LVLETDQPIEVRVLSKVTTSLSNDLLKVFEVHGVDGTRASRVVKLHRSENLCLALETITAPVNDLPGLVMKDHRHTNVYAIIREQYAIEIESVEQRIHQRMLKPEEATNLAATPNFPALCLDRIVRSATQAVAFIEWVIPAGRCRVREESFRS
jgi:DNA-binding GntR family transcriptional regulator